MMKIIVETIPHIEQRYDTVGDWQFMHNLDDPEGERTLIVRVSKMGDWRPELLVALHEIIEATLCKHDGVSEQAVDAFDKHPEVVMEVQVTGCEPGDMPKAPYKKQHCIATGIERILAAHLDVDWSEYEHRLASLPYSVTDDDIPF